MDILLLAIIQAPQAQPQAGSTLFNMLPIIVLFILFWVMIIVPQRRQVKAHQALVAALKKGDQVVTAGGIVGVITAVRDDAVEVRSGTATVVVQRARITQVVDADGAPKA